MRLWAVLTASTLAALGSAASNNNATRSNHDHTTTILDYDYISTLGIFLSHACRCADPKQLSEEAPPGW